jgi:hypothetical protein
MFVVPIDRTVAITIDVARTSFAGNFSQPMSKFVAQKIFCDCRSSAYARSTHCKKKMSVAPIDRRLYFVIAVHTLTIGDRRRTVGATDMFL